MKKFLPFLWLLVFVVVIFKPFFFEGKFPIPADTIVGLYHPWRDQLASQYPSGVPFKNFLITDPVRQQYVWRELGTKWNPYQSLGTPLLANIQAAQFYPLNLIYKFVPFSFGWSLQVVLQIFLGGIFMILYLRHLKLYWPSQVLGTLAWVGSGFFIAWLEWNTLVQVAIWIPLVLLGLEKKWWPIFIFALTSSFFAGHVQIFLYVLILTIAYALYHRKIGPSLVISFCVVGLLTFPQWWPMSTLVNNSVRSIGSNDWQVAGWFLPWQNLVQFVSPDYFGNPATLNYFGIWNYGEFIGYIGIIPLFFALLALKRQNIFWIVVIVLSLLFSLPNPISKLSLQIFQPTRLMILIDFSLSVLAAHGFDYYMKTKPKINSKLFLFGLMFGLLGLIAWKNNWVVSLKNLILPTGILMLGFIFIKYISRLSILAVLLLTVIDLSRLFIKFESFSNPQDLFPQTKITSFLQEKSQTDVFRVAALDDRIFPPNFSTHYKIQMVSGYDSWYPNSYIDYVGSPSRIITPKDSKFFDELNVKYLLSFDSLMPPKYELVFQEGQTKIYENKTVFPRISLSSGTAKITKYSEDFIAIETQSETTGQLILRDTFYPDWKAQIDGRPTNIFRSGKAFRAITVPQGQHLIRFSI